MSGNTSTCSACGKPIRWATTEKGKSMPLDDKPKTMWLIEGGGGAPVTTRPVQVRESHWGTCSDPDRFRKGGAA